jgi:hypothetical protein
MLPQKARENQVIKMWVSARLGSLPTVRVDEVLPREDADSKPVATATIVKVIR